ATSTQTSRRCAGCSSALSGRSFAGSRGLRREGLEHHAAVHELDRDRALGALPRRARRGEAAEREGLGVGGLAEDRDHLGLGHVAVAPREGSAVGARAAGGEQEAERRGGGEARAHRGPAQPSKASAIASSTFFSFADTFAIPRTPPLASATLRARRRSSSR